MSNLLRFVARYFPARLFFVAVVQGNSVAWVMEMGATLPGSRPFFVQRG
ncbi:hypothetical protein [Vannielia sp.]|nr:hypothetical protein [Vannielia sp.]MDF1873856.1 hypothetical protein [Vannielia sp.]